MKEVQLVQLVLQEVQLVWLSVAPAVLLLQLELQ